MSQLPNNSGTASRVTAAGATCLSSANAAVIGVLCCNSATAGTIQFFAGVTATGATGGKILTGVITFASGSVGAFLPMPVYASGGLCVNIGTADNPDLTIYWNPA